jgi:hypothetical protein
MTIGEDRVRVKFNPSLQDDVNRIKQSTAVMIDLIEQVKLSAQIKGGHSEVIRLCALAQTALEESAMWAVKALTYKPEDYSAEKED